MKPSTRVIIAGIVIELLLVAIAAYLLQLLSDGTLKPAGTAAATASTITTTIGTAMGALGGVILVVYVVLRRNEKRNAIR